MPQHVHFPEQEKFFAVSQKLSIFLAKYGLKFYGGIKRYGERLQRATSPIEDVVTWPEGLEMPLVVRINCRTDITMNDELASMLRITESLVIENVAEIRRRVEDDLGTARISEIVIKHGPGRRSAVVLVSDDLNKPLTYTFEKRSLATAFYHFVWEHFAELHGLDPDDRID